MPSLTIFAGPNGAGKSSTTKRSSFEGKANLLDADAVAKRMNDEDPTQAAIEAGREVISKTREFLEKGESFAIETTFSGRWALNAIQEASTAGFFVRLIYVGLSDPERAIQRVRERVAQGGHNVPEQDIRRRYERSLSHLHKALKKVDHALVYDNSSGNPKLLIEVRSGVVTHIPLDDYPWAQSLLQ